jgi:hypothetical protein
MTLSRPSPHRPSSLLAALALGASLAGCPDTHANDRDAASLPDAPGLDAPPFGGDGCVTCGDAPIGADAGVRPASCTAASAEIDVCAAICDAITGAFWDGTRCVEHSCNCTGADCEVYPTRTSCEAAHAHCDASLCLATGGRWFSRPQFCGHFECGTPPTDVLCDEPLPACDCGAYGIFVDGEGCMPGPLCELIGPRDPDVLCAETGGTWMTGICGHATCGRLSGLDCASPGCVCGTYEIFDDERGCIQEPDCDVRLPGESCTETQRCGEGSVCCANGGASIEASCVVPMCSDPSGVCGPPRA